MKHLMQPSDVHETLFNLNMFVQNFCNLNTSTDTNANNFLPYYQPMITFVNSKIYTDGGAQFNCIIYHAINTPESDDLYEQYEELYCSTILELNEHFIHAIPDNHLFKLILGDPTDAQCCTIIYHNPQTNDMITINHSHFTSSINYHLSNNYTFNN